MKTEDADIAKKPLLAALERVSVRIAMLDREFFQVAVIKLPCVLDYTMYTMRSKNDEVSMKLALVERTDKNGKKEIHGFVTDVAQHLDSCQSHDRKQNLMKELVLDEIKGELKT